MAPAMSLARTLEPEAMDTAEETDAYDAMDHRAVNDAFVADLLAVAPSPRSACSTSALAPRSSPSRWPPPRRTLG